MPRYPRFSRPIALGVATALASLAATAQESPAGLEEVVVTAQRVETDIQKTPVAVTALTGDFLRDYDFRQVTSIEGAAPNLNFAASTGGASSQVSAFIRGVGEFDFLLTTDPAVGLYIDGVYLARTFGANLDLADVERVEVLRGPQGTLFGKNNIGGAINLITRRPEGSGRTDAELTGGSYNSWRASIVSDIALGDDVALLLSAAGRKSDGWQDRPGADGGEENRVGARAALRFTPSDSFESTLALDYVDQDQTNYPNNMVVYDGHSANPATFLGLFNGFVSPTNPCCTPNASIDESGVTEGLLPHDDWRASASRGSTTGRSADGKVLQVDYRIPRHGGALRPRRRQLRPRLQRRRARRGPRPVQPGVPAREPGQRQLELDRGPVLLPRGDRATRRGSSRPTDCSTRCRAIDPKRPIHQRALLRPLRARFHGRLRQPPGHDRLRGVFPRRLCVRGALDTGARAALHERGEGVPPDGDARRRARRRS